MVGGTKCLFYHQWLPYGNFTVNLSRRCYRPDWTEPERLSYTISLFEILSALLPPLSEGSVSTLPASFKEFHPDHLPESAYKHLLTCAETIEMLSVEHQLDLHLGLEPEPLGWFENTPETLSFLMNYSTGPGTLNWYAGELV